MAWHPQRRPARRSTSAGPPASFLREVMALVLVEVTVAAYRSQLEDGLGGSQSPAGTGEVHAIFDRWVSAGAFDDVT